MMPCAMAYGYLHFWASLLIQNSNKHKSSGTCAVDPTETSVYIQGVSKVYIQDSGKSAPQLKKGKFHGILCPQTLGFEGKTQQIFYPSSPTSILQILVYIDP